MKPVVQEDEFGCGVACVANILGVSYQEALNLFYNGRAKAIKEGFLCRNIVSALGNLEYQYRYIKPKLKGEIYQNKNIVFIKRCKKYPQGHFLSRLNNKWVDSWLNLPDIDRKAGFRKRLPGKPIYLISKI